METLQQAIENITWRTERFPEKDFEIIRADKNAAIPLLRGAVERAILEKEKLDKNYQLHFYAIYLLGEFQDREFFPCLLKLAALPEKTLDFLIGDAITEGFPHILYNMYNGDLELLKRSVCDRQTCIYVRAGMLEMMGQLYLDHTLEKAEWQEFMRRIIYDNGETDDYIYTKIADLICECHFMEMLPEIQGLYLDERIETGVIGEYDECLDRMFTYHDGREMFCISPINASQMLKGWAMFQDDSSESEKKDRIEDFEKFFRAYDREFNRTEPKRKIGRNDPCPCGSGRKYKQCCLNKPKSPVELIESEQEKKKWLRDYPPVKKDEQKDRIYLEDFYDRESIETDKLLYLALKHRGIPMWRAETEDTVKHRKRIYLTGAFKRFQAVTEREKTKSFQEYDEKHSIHYFCEQWIGILRELLREKDEEGILEEVCRVCEKMGKT
ncbi:MAG: DUF1186 domain-containing protein [Lachnospiraceae bacterium]|nr:DUF1186 domain-containing protein [Lachnospiraceae bacterium]